MKKTIAFLAALAASAVVAGTTGPVEVPPDAVAATVDGRDYWLVDDVLVERREGFRAVVSSVSKPWPGGVVRYVFDWDNPEQTAKYGAVTEEQKAVFRRKIAEWTLLANVQFVESTDRTGIHVQVANSSGNYANDGYLGEEHPAHNIGLSDWERSSAHEMGHILSLGHEQARDDAVDFLAFDPPRYTPPDRTWTFDNLGTAYDFESVMHYPVGVHGGYSMRCLPQYAEYDAVLGNRDFVTALDHLGLARIYGMKPVVCDMTFDSDPAGQAAVTCAGAASGLAPGSTFDVAMTPKDSSMEFDRWVSDPPGAVHFADCWAAATTATAALPGKVVARFKRTVPPPPPPETVYTVVFSASKGGQVYGALTQTVAPGGSTTGVWAKPAENYLFSKWIISDGGETIVNPVIVSGVSSDMTITACFEWDPAVMNDDPEVFKVIGVDFDSSRKRLSAVFEFSPGDSSWMRVESNGMTAETDDAGFVVAAGTCSATLQGDSINYNGRIVFIVVKDGVMYRSSIRPKTEKTTWRMTSSSDPSIIGFAGTAAKGKTGTCVLTMTGRNPKTVKSVRVNDEIFSGSDLSRSGSSKKAVIKIRKTVESVWTSANTIAVDGVESELSLDVRKTVK